MTQNNPTTTKLCNKMRQAGYEEFKMERVKKLVDELQQHGVQGIDGFLRKLAKRVTNKQGYYDILKEGRFALTLARNKFSQVQIEYSSKGPDLKANYNRRTLYFEVTRRHSEVDEWVKQSEDALPPPDNPENIISRIQGKMSQLRSGELNILVFCSDTVAVLEFEMKKAFNYIQQEINHNPGVYGRISGVLFTEGGYDVATLKQYHLFTNNKASKRLPPRLARKLESLGEKDRGRLQRKFDALAIAMKKPCDNKAQQNNGPKS